MIIPSQTIRKLKPIAPFHDRTVVHGRTFGLSCAGYDVRIAQTIWLFPLIGRLASTVERFDMPSDLLGIVHDKSSNARRFISVQNTVIEPGWCGYLTLELTLHRLWPVRIAAGTPIAQIIFHRLETPSKILYSGKYQDQPNRPVGAINE